MSTPQTISVKLPSLHAGQLKIIKEAKRFNILACGRRFGKTVLGIDRIIQPALKGLPVAYFEPTYKMLTEVWRELCRVLKPVISRTDVQQHRLELISGGVVDCWSLDSPDVARGRKYARVVIDEAAMVRHLKAAWEEVIRPTLTDLIGDAWFLSTPKGYNYFHDLFQRGKSKEPIDSDYASWQMPTTSNPFINPKEVEDAKCSLASHVYDQEYLALFISAPGGRVIDVWSSENISEEADYIVGSGDTYWAVDDGYAGEIDKNTGFFTANSHPRVFVNCQLRGDGTLAIFDEDYRIKTIDTIHLKDVIRIWEEKGYPLPLFAAVDKSAAQLKGAIWGEGIAFRNSAPRVEESLKELRKWVAPDINGVRRIIVHPRCKHLIHEFESYTLDEITGQPIKQHDHGIDALRGLVWNLRF